MTTSSTPKRQARRAPAKVRQVLRQKQAFNQSMTDQIMNNGAALASAAAQAAAVTKGGLTEAEIQVWVQDLDARLAVIAQHPEQNLGHIEEQIARSAKEPLRLVAERAAQAKANATPCCCPDCQLQLV